MEKENRNRENCSKGIFQEVIWGSFWGSKNGKVQLNPELSEMRAQLLPPMLLEIKKATTFVP